MKFEKDMRIILDKDLLGALKRCVTNAYPNESGGLIFGDITQKAVEGGFQYDFLCKKFECFVSNEKSPVSYWMSNIEVLFEFLQKYNDKYKLKLISIFHSHPSGSYPSGFDDNYMDYLFNFPQKALKNAIWTIMDGSNFNLKGFFYLDDEIVQVNVIIK